MSRGWSRSITERDLLKLKAEEALRLSENSNLPFEAAFATVERLWANGWYQGYQINHEGLIVLWGQPVDDIAH